MPPVSSSAPPMFRAKQKSPVKPKHGMPPGSAPMAASNRPQIIRPPAVMRGGPPVDQGYPEAGTSSMVAPPPNGRMMANGGMAPGMRPPMRPNGGMQPRGGMAGGMERNGGMMMADGGFGDPGMMGMGSEPDSGADQQPQHGGPMDADVVITPEMVAFHDEDQDCQGCKYYGQDGNCAVLKIQVGPEAGCNAWTSGGMSQDETGGQPGEDDGGNPMGTSGMPQP